MTMIKYEADFGLMQTLESWRYPITSHSYGLSVASDLEKMDH